MPDRLDVVLYGATGFTGSRIARYVAGHAPAGLRWAVAGRSRPRLEALADETQPAEVIVADSADPGSVDAMVARARVVIAAAGPFALYGTPVVDACVRHDVDYVDISGETGWVAGLIARHHATAAASHTRIIPMCGYDSVPSDVGTLYVTSFVRRTWGEGTQRVSASFTAKGGFSGGTLATMLLAAESGEMRAENDVLLLNPPEHRGDAERARSRDFKGVRRDRVRERWLAPSVMARLNTRVVRRSAALMADYGAPYGAEFAYEEAEEHRSRMKAHAVSRALAALETGLAFRPARSLMRRFAPSPGEGPSQHELDRGFMRVRLLGRSESGRKAMATLRAHGNPGYVATPMFVAEAALMLATGREALAGGPDRGGVLTPATGLGLGYLERLQAAGLRAEVEPVGEDGR